MEAKLKGWIAIIAILSLTAGVLITNGFSSNEKQELSDKLMAYCNDELLPAYESGFMTTLISELDAFARNCIGGDVKLFSWVRLNGEKEGILFQCTATNVTYPLEYPDIKGFRK